MKCPHCNRRLEIATQEVTMLFTDDLEQQTGYFCKCGYFEADDNNSDDYGYDEVAQEIE
jgi:C4-type Zn-finger protein